MKRGGGDSRIKVATLERNSRLLGAKGLAGRASRIPWPFTGRHSFSSYPPPYHPPTHLDHSDFIKMARCFVNVVPIEPELYINPAGNAAG